MSEKNKIRPIFIPKNFQNEAHILGIIDAPWANVIQGIVTGGGAGYLVWGINKWTGLNYPFAKIVGVLIIVVGLFGYLGLVGINGGTLLAFVKTLIRYTSNKRRAYYNPRVKKEVKFRDVVNGDQELLPRDKILLLYNRMTEENKKRHQAEAEKFTAEMEEQIGRAHV